MSREQRKPAVPTEATIRDMCHEIVANGLSIAALAIFAWCEGRSAERLQIIDKGEHLRNPNQKARLDQLDDELAEYLIAFGRIKCAMTIAATMPRNC